MRGYEKNMAKEKKGKDGYTTRQRKYVSARLAGKPINECKEIAGYSPKLPTDHIERPGNAVWIGIRKALSDQGIDDNWLAKELKASVEKAETAITRFNPKTGEIIQDPDLAAKERFIGRICKLKGYERELPQAQVAIQINNQFPGIENLAHGEAERIIDALRAEINARERADVLEASVGDEDPGSRSSVDTVGTDPQEATGD